MYKFLPVLLFFVFFISCTGKNDIPADVLSPSKMEPVMWDMFRADEYVTSYIWKNDSGINRLDSSFKLYEEIFRIHGITRKKFEKSLSFYRTHPELMKRVIDSLSSEEHPYKKRIPVAIEADSASIKKSITPIQ